MDKIEKPDKWTAWAAQHLGGPISLIVFDGCALTLNAATDSPALWAQEIKVPFLEWFENH